MPVGIRHNTLVDTPLILHNNIEGGRESLSVSVGMLGNKEPAHTPANLNISTTQMLHALENEIASGRCRNIGYSRRALSSLRKTATDGREPFDLALLLRWYDDMRAKRLHASTIRGYLEAMQALYRRIVPAGTMFRHVRAAIGTIDTTNADTLPDISLEALCRIAARDTKMPAAMRLALDIFLLNVYNGAPFSTIDLVDMRTDACSHMPSQARDIAAAYTAPRRKYIFPLGQGRHTSASIARALQPRIASALRIAGICHDADTDTTRIAAACWHAAATQAGINTSHNPTPDDLADTADSILDTHPHWYAMRLRQRTHPDDIAARIANTSLHVDTYYPCREIVRRCGSAMHTDTQAFIAGVLFFRTTRATLPPLFRLIGDIAWGYRTTPATDAPYAPIPDDDMLTFQRMICVFTPDMTIRPLHDHNTLQPGRRVRIIGGVMAGYEGTIHDATGHGSTPTTRIFRLRISHDFGFEWTVEIPEALILPL